MSNFLEPGGDDENLRRSTDWEAQVQTLRVNFAACESISKWPEQKFNKFSLKNRGQQKKGILIFKYGIEALSHICIGGWRYCHA